MLEESICLATAADFFRGACALPSKKEKAALLPTPCNMTVHPRVCTPCSAASNLPSIAVSSYSRKAFPDSCTRGLAWGAGRGGRGDREIRHDRLFASRLFGHSTASPSCIGSLSSASSKGEVAREHVARALSARCLLLAPDDFQGDVGGQCPCAGDD